MKLTEYRAALQRMIRGEQRVHIPVRPDDDDVLIHNALDDLEAAWEQVKRLKEENDRLLRFKAYFDELYGEGLEVDYWHKNGDLEPFDNFYDSAVQEMESSDRIQEGIQG